MDLGALPPDITSALMYSGPGSAPMMAAASAWNGLAAELNSAATGYNTVVSQLSGEEWLGPASASMAQAAAPYVTWMNTTAAQAEQTATQAMAVASAYETAHAAVVPPPIIAANRAQLVRLVSTNTLGQNTPAIAANQAQYGEMWAQDAAAMYSYAASSSAATSNVTTFASPAATTSSAGVAAQSASVAQAASSATSTSVLTSLEDLWTQLQTELTSLYNSSGLGTFFSGLTLGTPTIATGSLTYPTTSIIGELLTGLTGSNVLNAASPVNFASKWIGPAYNTLGLPYFSTGMANSLLSISKGLAPAAAAAAAPAAAAAAGNAAGLGGGLGGIGSGVAAGLGQGAGIGGFSVPPAWSGAVAPIHPATAPLPISGISAAPEAGGPGSLLGGMPLAGVPGIGGGGAGPRYGFRPTVMARPPFAG
jgi:PPE-repeat protein